MNCYEIIETHRTNSTVNVLAELHCEEEKIKAEFARWAAWLDEANNSEAVELWEEIEHLIIRGELDYFVYDGYTFSFRLKEELEVSQ